jgi:hypothetical protein
MGSRGTVGSPAVPGASQAVQEKMRQIAAHLMELLRKTWSWVMAPGM